MNAYHNLAGWLRDVRAVLNHGDRDDLGATYLAQVCDLLTELTMGVIGDEVERQLELLGNGADEPDAEDVESPDADDDVVVQRSGNGSRPGEIVMRSIPGRKRTMGGAAGVADTLPRDVQKSGRGSASRTPAVAGARKRVSRGKK